MIRTTLNRAIQHALNYHGIDARLNKADWEIADLLEPEIQAWLDGRVIVDESHNFDSLYKELEARLREYLKDNGWRQGSDIIVKAADALADMRRQLETMDAWKRAEQARHDAVDAYNTKLKRHQAEGVFPARVQDEYFAMQAANNHEADCRKALFTTLTSAPELPAKEGR